MRDKTENISDMQIRSALVNNFYHNNFEKCQTNLKSTNIRAQFEAACVVFGLDSEFIKSPEESSGKLKKNYRVAVLRYHPDKFKDGLAKTRVEEIFKLLDPARLILEEIIKDPTVLDEEEILKQTEERPAHQYEDPAFNTDPYYYIDLARNPQRRFNLNKFWEFVEEPCSVSSTFENTPNSSHEIVIYKPQLNIFKTPEQIQLSGAEAFYHLFMSGSLPRRFDQHHLAMIFQVNNGESLNDAQRWLLKKVLSTPEFIGFMDSNDVMRLAILATQENILHIGSNETDVFLYFYAYLPETFYQRRIEKFRGEQNIDRRKIEETILGNPYNLNRMFDRALDEIVKITPALNDMY